MKTGLAVALAAGMMTAGAGAAYAQSLQSHCLQQVDDMCGHGNLGQCFQGQGMWQMVYNECIGDVQTLIEMEREALADPRGGYDGKSGYVDHGVHDNFGGTYAAYNGFSYGGVLRNGPGVNYGRQASLVNGDWIEVVEATGDWYDGYQWYYVNTWAGYGYHWGGIFCTEGYADGVLADCSQGY